MIWSLFIVIPVPLQLICFQSAMHLFTAAATAYSNAFYGRGTGPILMDNVACTSVETGLINCTFDNHTSDCSHSEDAGVRCYSPPTTGEYLTQTLLLISNTPA